MPVIEARKFSRRGERMSHKRKLKTPVVLLDTVETSKRRAAWHLLKVSRYELSNAVIADALGWTIDQLLDFYREDKPCFVVRRKK